MGNNEVSSNVVKPKNHSTKEILPTTDQSYLNPLLFDEILLAISSRLSSKDLVASRLVCKKWNYVFCPILQKRGPILCFNSPRQCSTGSPSFTNIMEKSRNNPCGRFALRGVKRDLGEYFDLIKIVQESITHIEFETEFSVSGLKTLKNFLMSAPNLKILKIPHFQDLESEIELQKGTGGVGILKNFSNLAIKRISGRGKLSKSLFQWIFKSARKLSKLSLSIAEEYEHISDIDHVEETMITNACLILSTFADYGRLSHLSILKLNRINDKILSNLVQLGKRGLNLKQFVVGKSMQGPITSEVLGQFLCTQHNTLEALTFNHINYNVSFLNMPKLKFLEIGFISAGYDSSLFPCLNYSKQFPSLETFNFIGECSLECENIFFDESLTCTSLNSLRLPSCLGKEAIEVCAKIFPNLENLEVRRPWNETLTAVWCAWPRIKNLRIVATHGRVGFGDDEYLDPGFLGESQEECRRSHEILGHFPHDFTYPRDNPCVNDLKELQHMELYFISLMGERKAGIVSDALVYQGLMGMKQLKSLGIWEDRPRACPGENITEERTSDLSAKSIYQLKEVLSETKVKVSGNGPALFKYKWYHMGDCAFDNDLADLKIKSTRRVRADKIIGVS